MPLRLNGPRTHLKPITLIGIICLMQGWNPDDFQRQGRRPTHPDIMQPGPGRGTDFDSMFG